MKKDTDKLRRFLRRWLRRVAVGLACTLVVSAGTLAILWRVYPFPLERLESWPASVVVTDRNGRAMLERPGSDGQWRVPVRLASISQHVVDATIAAEDKRFYSHWGVDGWAAVRAAGQNVRGMRRVSGASTLTMQVCRIMDVRPRTVWAKAVECFRALQLEQLYTKEQILETYLNIAPYDGNVRGIEAAAVTYYGKHAKDLSLAEAATLAGVPQSPKRYRPDKHGERAAERQGAVLARMQEEGMISASQVEQATAERPVARCGQHVVRAPHAAWLALSQRPGGGRTTIDLDVQEQVERLAARHAAGLPAGCEVAAVVADIPTGEIVAMVGSLDASRAHDGQVNGAIAWRSPGSALKPFVYGAAFEARRLGPDSIVYDVPIHRAGWSPENFDKTFSGPLRADDALRRSLNVPAILVAEGVGLGRCRGMMESAGVRLPTNAESRGGLAIVTGGIEVRLVDLVTAYATIGRGGRYMAWRLLGEAGNRQQQEERPGTWDQGPGEQQTTRRNGALAFATGSISNSNRNGTLASATGSITTTAGNRQQATGSGEATTAAGGRAISADVCMALDEILSSHKRRPIGMEDLLAEQVPWFMWKTGTSSGRRDAVAVGHNGRYAIGVWVGRFGGAGDGAIVGAQAAEPLLAQLFALKALRVDAALATGPAWTVRFGLGEPAELAGEVKILYPHSGAVFMAMDGQAIVQPVANHPDGLNWFLNGVLVEPSQAGRLVLGKGSYELRCADAAGSSSSVRFLVK